MKNENYKISFLQDTGGDNYGEIEEVKYVSNYDNIKKYFLDNKDKENTRTDSYGNRYSSYYKIYDPNGNEITNDFKKEIKNEEKNKDNQTNNNLSEDIVKDEENPNFAIKITPDKNFSPEFKKLFKKTGIFDKIHSGDSAITVMQMVNELDQVIKNENFSKNKFPKETLNFEIQTPSGSKLNFNAPMGRNLFLDGNLEKLINTSSEKITNNVLSEQDKRDWSKIFEKDKNKRYKLKVNTKSIENAIDGGIDELAKAGKGLGDDNVEAFLVAFTNSYGLDRNFNFPNNNNNKKDEKEKNKDNEKPIKKQDNAITEKELSNIGNLANEAVSKITKTKEKEKGISKPTSLGIS